MKLFLDTELNGFMGELMSMALVPEDPKLPEFYVELELPKDIHPWVQDNVVPHLFLKPVTIQQFQAKLANYLLYIGDLYGDCTIVADWPDDIKYFCQLLITGPGEMINLYHKIHFELDTTINYTSEVPHNALYDARGIRNEYLKGLK